MSDNVTSAFDKGRTAFQKGWLQCPYREKSQLAKEWHRGFNNEYFAHREIVKREEASGYKRRVHPGYFAKLRRTATSD